jgi:hypothetical protein
MASLPPDVVQQPLAAQRDVTTWIDRGLGFAIGFAIALVWWLVVVAAGAQIGFTGFGFLGRYSPLAVASTLIGAIWLRGRLWILLGAWLGHTLYLAIIPVPREFGGELVLAAPLLAGLYVIPTALGLLVGSGIAYLVRLATEE